MMAYTNTSFSPYTDSEPRISGEKLAQETTMASMNIPPTPGSNSKSSIGLEAVPLDIAMASTTVSPPPDGNSKPSMSLETLPQEIKDQVYGYVVGGIFSMNLDYDGPDYPPEPPSRFTLFLASKRVRREAVEVFFSQNLFRYELGVRRRFCLNIPIDRIMHLELALDDCEHGGYCSWWDDTDPDEYEKDLLDSGFGILKYFGGTEVLRKTVRIKFEKCLFYDYGHPMYFHLLKTLTGLQTVIAQISSYPIVSCLVKCEGLRTAMRDMLEPALGPAKYGDGSTNLAGGNVPDLLLEFHPRDYMFGLKGAGRFSVTEHIPRGSSNPGSGGFQIDADELRQRKDDAAEAQSGAWEAAIPRPEQEQGAITPVSTDAV